MSRQSKRGRADMSYRLSGAPLLSRRKDVRSVIPVTRRCDHRLKTGSGSGISRYRAQKVSDHGVLGGENRAQVEQDAGVLYAGNDGRVGLAEATAKVVGA